MIKNKESGFTPLEVFVENFSVPKNFHLIFQSTKIKICYEEKTFSK